jgi:NADH-quinone oxidoreductase subunit H
LNSVFFILPFLLTYTVIAVYAERKMAAFIQNRMGPMEVGFYGTLQVVADLLKLFSKEHITPDQARPLLFRLAPILIFAVVFTGLALVPVGPSWQGAGLSSGLFFILAILSLEIPGILLAGYASSNKYSTLGSIRAVAQIISYEIPMGLCILSVIVFTGTLNLDELIKSQAATGGTYWLGISGIPFSASGGFFSWNIFLMPTFIPLFLIYFMCSLAESNRAPFDLPEAESELVAGFHTEYSGFPWAVIMLAEYAMMLLTSVLGVILFFGGYQTIFPNIGDFRMAELTSGPVWGIVWLYSKSILLVFIQIWIRWTFPRVRINQLLTISWKYLTPASILLFVLTCIWTYILN